MISKNSTDVIINGKIYTLSGYESEEYLHKVAAYMNNKINEMRENPIYSKQNSDVQRMLLELNIADDYFKAKKQADAAENDIHEKAAQIYDLKHELVSVRIEAEAAKKEAEALSVRIEEQQLEIVRLETELADAPRKSVKNPKSST